MLKLISFAAFGFALFSYASCRASEIRVQVFRGAEMVQAITLPEGKLKVAAKNFNFDSEMDAWNLTGGCAITVVQDEKHSIRLEGETAKVTAANEDIEWQISSSDPIDIRNAPPYELLGTLKKITKESPVRLMWYYTMGGYWQGSTALYNRSNNTLKEYSLVSDSSAGTGGIYGYFYSDVTDEMIKKMASDDNYSGPFSFSRLEKFGGTRKERR